MGRAPATQSNQTMFRTQADPHESVTKGSSNEDTASFIEAQYFDENHSEQSNPSPFDGMVNQYGVGVETPELQVHPPKTSTEKTSRNQSQQRETTFSDDFSVSRFPLQQWKENDAETFKNLKELKQKAAVVSETETRHSTKEKVKQSKQPIQQSKQLEISQEVPSSHQVNQSKSFKMDANKASKVEDSAVHMMLQ